MTKATSKTQRIPSGLRREAKRHAAFPGGAPPKAPSPLRSAGAVQNLETELLILPDGRILVHNLTEPFAQLLRELNPDDEQISQRITHHASRPHELPD